MRAAFAWLVVLAVAVAACGGGDWEPYEPNVGELPDDSIKQATYPSGSVGTKIGDTVAESLQFDALLDPETFCKPADKLELASTEGKQVLTMTDFFRGDRFCPKVKKQFLWVVVTAGW